jgi:hypothetical protein
MSTVRELRSHIPNLGKGFVLRCFQLLSRPHVATLRSFGNKADRPAVRSTRSSRTRVNVPQVFTPTADRDQPVSRISVTHSYVDWTICSSLKHFVEMFGRHKRCLCVALLFRMVDV